MKDIAQMFKQAQKLQERMGDMQRQLDELRIPGSAGGGMVALEIDGKGRLMQITIEPELCKPEDTAILSDLILAASHNARESLDEELARRFGEMTGGMPMPDMLKGMF